MLPIIYYNLETKSQTIMRLQILTERSRVEGCSFIKHYKFDIGHTVPIYDVSTMNALNQIIGHVKFQNANYGNVFYRGVGGLYKNVLPALMRERAKGIPNDLCQTLNSIINDSYFKESLKLFNPVVPRTDKDYIISTRWLHDIINIVQRRYCNTMQVPLDFLMLSIIIGLLYGWDFMSLNDMAKEINSIIQIENLCQHGICMKRILEIMEM